MSAGRCPRCGEEGGDLPDHRCGPSTVPSRRTPAEADTDLAGSAPKVLDRGPIAGGRYTLLEAVGSGGGGAVYRAWDRELGLQVALKVLAPEWATEIHLKRLKREIRITRDIDHPNVSRVFDLGESDGTTFLTMRWIDGEALGHRVRRKGPLETAALRRLARGLVAALAAAHRLGVVHRDVKPANVLVSEDGDPVLVDFGVATDAGTSPQSQMRRGERITLDGQVPGTPAFMAPEQARGEAATPAADLYALALTVAYAAAGDATVPDRPEKTFARLGQPLASILVRCFSPNAAERPRDAAAIEAALARTARRRRVVGATALAIVLVGAAILASVVSARRAAREASARGPRLVWIAPIENPTADPELAWLEHGVRDLVAAGLESSGRVRVASDGANRRRADRIVGRISATSVDLSLVDPSGRTLARGRIPWETADAFFAAVDATVYRFRGALGVPASRPPPPARRAFVSDLEAFAHYERAQADIRRHRYQDALVELRRAVEREPTFARAHLQRYVLVWTSGHGARSEAEAALEAARRDRRRLPPRERELLDALLEARPERARIEPLLAYLRTHPADGSVYRMASDLLRASRTRRRMVLEEWVSRLPDDPEVHNQLAFLYRAAGDRDRAERELHEYLRLAPAEANAHDSHGDFLRGEGRFAEAIEAYDEALRLDPAFSSAAVFVVDAAFQSDDLDLARARLAKAWEMVPPDSRDFAWLVALQAAVDLVSHGPREAVRALGDVARRPSVGSRAFLAHDYEAIVHGLSGHAADARRAAQEAVAERRRYHGPRASTEGIVPYVEGLAAWRRRDRGAIERAVTELESLGTDGPGAPLAARIALLSALREALSGDEGIAAEHLLAVPQDPGGTWFLAMLERARLLARLGRLAEADDAYAEAVVRRRHHASSAETAFEWRACLREAAARARDRGDVARADGLGARLRALTGTSHGR